MPVLRPSGTVEEDLTALSAQMRQGVYQRLWSGLATLKSLKAAGRKVGRLKFKSEVNSIPLKQHKGTYTLLLSENKVHLQGMKRPFKVFGMKQIPADAEIASGNLVRDCGDYYIQAVCYTAKDEVWRQQKKVLLNHTKGKAVGLDLGCSTQLTTSDGVKIEFNLQPTKHQRRLDRRISRRKHARGERKTANHFKAVCRRRKLYQHLQNQKKDIGNKVVSAISKNVQYVALQDDCLRGWAGRHGKKIQGSALGRIKCGLQQKPQTPLAVSRFYPSTKKCSGCGSLQVVTLDERIYRCLNCGLVKDRDVNAATNILGEGLNQLVPAERREITPLETWASHQWLSTALRGLSVALIKSESLKEEAVARR